MKKVLTIAGSDCSGGAGLQADLKTFAAHGVYGMSVVVSVVAENTSRVIDIQDMEPEIIEKQIDAVFEDIEVDAVKIGMLSGLQTMEAVFRGILKYKPQNIVIDPVMNAKGGHALMQTDAISFFNANLLPISDLITPNIPEAEIIASIKIETPEHMRKAAEIIYQMGAKNVLIKGGHLEGEALDVLFDGNDFYYFKQKRINTKNTHGTGCTYSSAIAANLAMGMELYKAVENAKEYITNAIEYSLEIGRGNGPLGHFHKACPILSSK